MGDSARRIISDQLEVLSRTTHPANFIISKIYEFAVKHPACALAIVCKDGQVNITKNLKIPPQLLENEGPMVYRRGLYYVRRIRSIESHIVLTPDKLSLPSKTAQENLTAFVIAVDPYLKAIEDIIKRSFAEIVLPLSTEAEPMVLSQAVRGQQVLTFEELIRRETTLPPEMGQAIQSIFFRSKVIPGNLDRVSPTFLTLKDGRVVLPTRGIIKAQEYVELGNIPYRFEDVEGAVPARKVITSFLQIENKSIAQLLEDYSELAYFPFFFDLYLKNGGPPIRHVALFDGRLIIGRSPESNPEEGMFEVFLAKAGLEKQAI
jgi:hypothetical protein